MKLADTPDFDFGFIFVGSNPTVLVIFVPKIKKGCGHFGLCNKEL